MTNGWGVGQPERACCSRMAPEKAVQGSRYHQVHCTGENPQRKSLHGLIVKTAVQLQSTKPGLLAHPTLLQRVAASHSGLRHPLSLSLGLAVCYGLTTVSTSPQCTLCVPAFIKVPCALVTAVLLLQRQVTSCTQG